ncbi:MepB family protein [Staphylococcus xylosus]|uniref:MepB family protein n=1 Tax=Staphylococcus xylosus TaxID=1288 RepID=A0A939SRX5_STAXY|nr:MepB family protein [Staphylococcus xylosus]
MRSMKVVLFKPINKLLEVESLKTPNKQGYFVVFWTKDNENKNRPFTYNESCDKLIITVIDENHKYLYFQKTC